LSPNKPFWYTLVFPENVDDLVYIYGWGGGGLALPLNSKEFNKFEMLFPTSSLKRLENS